jgi:hypothetical protein
MELSSDVEMQKVTREAQEFFENVLCDYEPMFVSDEATIWDVSVSTADELLEQCSKYYGKVLSEDDLNLPLWKLLRQLNEGRAVTKSSRVPQVSILRHGKLEARS